MFKCIFGHFNTGLEYSFTMDVCYFCIFKALKEEIDYFITKSRCDGHQIHVHVCLYVAKEGKEEEGYFGYSSSSCYLFLLYAVVHV